MEWIMLDLTKNEVEQRFEDVVLCILKVPLQGSGCVPVRSALPIICAVKRKILPTFYWALCAMRSESIEFVSQEKA
jgi:hypothetical protein